MITDLQKAKRFADDLYNKACRIRDTKGYHENLGYEWVNRLSNYMDRLDLTYVETCQMSQYYFSLCDKI